MDPLEQTVHLNNEAATLAQSGRPADCIHILQRALVTLKTCEYNRAHQEQSPVTCSRAVATRSASPPMAHKKGGDLDWHDQTGLAYIYDRPLFLSTDVKACSPEHFTHIFQAVSMATVFNLALAYHLYGRITGAELPSARAIDLYTMVLTGFDFDSPNIGVVTNGFRTMSHALWKCLVLNNLAHLHEEICDYSKTRCYMESLTNIVRRTDCLCKAAVDATLRDDEISSITLNVYIINHSFTAAKAA